MKVMQRIKKFLLDDTGTAEATSTVVMIAGVGLVLATGIYVWYTYLNQFFSTAGAGAAGAADSMKWIGP
jgi:hypothetical protein